MSRDLNADNLSRLSLADKTVTADRKLLIAVDFVRTRGTGISVRMYLFLSWQGTTFSGVAWAQTRQVSYPTMALPLQPADHLKPDELHTIELWPDGSSRDLEGTSNPKVPT